MDIQFLHQRREELKSALTEQQIVLHRIEGALLEIESLIRLAVRPVQPEPSPIDESKPTV